MYKLHLVESFYSEEEMKMWSSIQQDLNQIRQLSQRLSQDEQRNNQLLNQYQHALQQISAHESNASSQLQQIIQICNRIEQTVSSITQRPFSYTTGFGQPYVPSGAISQAMQADRQFAANEGPSYTNYNIQGTASRSGFQGGGSQQSFVNQSAIQQTLQADRQSNEGPSYTNYN